MSFVHLHVHSEYSLLDGFSNIEKLIERTKQMEMPALALTDHGTMFGVIEFYNQAKKAGIKPIIGIEAYLAQHGIGSRDPQAEKRSTHLLLLAENQTGYQNLLKLASAAQLEGFYYYPRVDHELLEKYSKGLICTSGCMSAEVPRLIAEGNLEAARRQLDWYYEIFGHKNFFLELQEHDIPELGQINRQLIQLGRRYQANFVATNDVHYINPEDARLQDIMLAIQTGTVLSDPNRMRMTDPSYYLRSPQEMTNLFAEVPEALANTLAIAERCNIDLGFQSYHLPNFDVPAGFSAESYLRSLCESGLQHRFKSRADDPMLRQRLDYELEIIHKMGFEPYFLIVWDLCHYAREQGIWYNARGSAAGSIVAYTLDITLVDPIEHGLIFERFLNPGRVSMPDIDLDFRDDRRAEMMEYATRKYGDDRVAQIITFGTLGARAAIRDVGRVMDIPLSDVDRLAKLVPNIPGKPITIKQALEEVPEFHKAYESAPYLKELVDTAANMEGVVRNAGTHAAGVIIADQPIIEYVPLHRPTGTAAGESPVKIVTQFEMNILDSLGLLKVDFLGLATLTIMAKACDLINRRHGVRYHLGNIPTDDPQTYELLGRGETAGVFQVEGSGMRRWLMEMKPKELKHVVAMVALFRPGPMEFIPGYIRRMHGEETVKFHHPWLEEIFKETYGYPVYQEQLMFAVMKLAGYTAPEADDFRKAIAKKMPGKLDAHRQKFIDGAKINNIPTTVAAAIFTDWEEFARYGFNKSHAVDYAVIAVQTAYLKLHYPVEYMTALLSVSKNDTAKVAIYTADARRMGVAVEPPDINSSDWDFSIEDCDDGNSVIRFGLGAVKNVGQGAVETILKARQEGPFTDVNDFARRVDLRQVGRRAMECLTKVGALESFGNRIQLLDALDQVVAISSSHFRAVEAGQMSMFGSGTGIKQELPLPPARDEISRREILGWERELIGVYVTDHPLSPVMGELEDVVTHYSSQLAEAANQDSVRVAGIVLKKRSHVTKSGQMMAFVTLEDLQGTIELVIFPRAWERFADIVSVDRIVIVEGKIDAVSGEPKVLVDNISTTFNKVVSTDRRPSIKDNSSNMAAGWSPETKPQSIVQMEPKIPIPEKPVKISGPDEAELKVLPGKDWGNIPHPPEEPPDWLELLRTPVGSNIQADAHAVIESLIEDAHSNVSAGNGLPDWDEIQIPAEESERVFAAPEQNPDMAVETIPEAKNDAKTSEFSHRIADSSLQVIEKAPIEAPLKPPVINPPMRKPSAADNPNGVSITPSYLISPLLDLDETSEVHMLTVVLRSGGDKTRDVLRLRRIHGVIISYPGDDRFAFQVYERNQGYLLEFPNSSTRICQELLDRLNIMVGSENIRVEPIKFQ